MPKRRAEDDDSALAQLIFLVHDFVTACASGQLPPNNAWDAARYMLPGLVAHESALQGGALLPIPDFGDPP